MRIQLTIAAVSTGLLAAAAWANWNDTSTGIDLTRLPEFPLTKVRAGLLGNNAQVRFDGLLASMRGPANGPAVEEVVLLEPRRPVRRGQFTLHGLRLTRCIGGIWMATARRTSS